MKRILLPFFALSLIYHTVHAKVVIQNVTISSETMYGVSGKPVLKLDFNGDEIPDLQFAFFSQNVPAVKNPVYVCNSVPQQGVGRDGYGENIQFQALNGAGFYTGAGTGLASGAAIGDARTYTDVTTDIYKRGGPEYGMYDMVNECYKGPMVSYSGSGLWSSNPSGYLGVRFKIDDLWHYGYIKFEVIQKNYTINSPFQEFRITAIAYEDVAGAQISTGAVPVTTGINEALSSEISIYPNPSTGGNLIIDSKENIEKIVLFNSIGQTETHYAQLLQTSMKGIVIVKIYTSKGIAQKRIVIN